MPEPQDETELAAQAIGQGRVEASPAHMAGVAAAAVTGRWRQPFVVEGEGASETEAPGDPDVLSSLMEQAVEDGTGTAAAADGVTVLGKTGTAQVDDGEHAWFVGVAPELFGEDGSAGLAFAVLVEGGGAGGETAAPLAADLVGALAE
ncbi:penicillin-binding transpeptidase domain-containing protein [Egibacter rhizosphaerae]